MDWGLCSSKQGKSVDGPSGGGGREQGEETEGRMLWAHSKGKKLGGEKGTEAEEGCSLPGTVNDSNSNNL